MLFCFKKCSLCIRKLPLFLILHGDFLRLSLCPPRAVRALCNHMATGAGQLSFCKGDILQVLDTVNEDWIQCCRGDSRGLVPVSYTSLIL